MFKGMRKEFISVTLLRVLGFSLAFILGVVVARVLTVEAAGRFFLFLTLVATFSSFGVFGATNVLIKEASFYNKMGDFASVNYIISFLQKRVYFMSLLSSLILAIIIYLFFQEFFLELIFLYIVASLVSIILFALILMESSKLHARFQTSFSIVVSFVSIPAIFITGVYLLEANTETVLLVIYTGSLLLVYFFSRLYGYLVVSKKQGPTNFDVSDAIEKKLSTSFKHYGVISFLNQLVQQGGIFVSAIWLANDEVALLTVSQKLSILIGFSLLIANTVLSPKIAYYLKNDHKQKAISLFAISIWAPALISLPFVVVVLSFTEEVLAIYGDGYIGAVTILQILVISQFVNVLTGAVATLIGFDDGERVVRNSMFLSLFIVFLVIGICVPLYGVVGAAIALALGTIVQNLILFVYAVNKYELKLKFLFEKKRNLKF